MIGFVVGLIWGNWIPVLVGVLGTLAVEHGISWTVTKVKGFIGRNVSSAENNVKTVQADVKTVENKVEAAVKPDTTNK